MTNLTTSSPITLMPGLDVAWQDVDSSFERFCLTAGIGAMEQMLCEDAQRLTGARHSRGGARIGHRWGTTEGPIGFHGGKVVVRRPRVRSCDGHEVQLPTWTAAQSEDWLGRWAMNLMLINVSTRKFRRAVRLPDGDLPTVSGDGTSKSAASRRFVALSAKRMAEWMASDLSQLDLLVIQIDGLHIGNDLILVAALGAEERRNTGAGWHLGSRKLVRSLTSAEKESVRLALSIDMVGVGWALNVRGLEARPNRSARKLLRAADALGISATYLRDTGQSDHDDLTRGGVPAAWIEWRWDPCWHMPCDRIHRLRPWKLRQAGRVVREAALQVVN